MAFLPLSKPKALSPKTVKLHRGKTHVEALTFEFSQQQADNFAAMEITLTLEPDLKTLAYRYPPAPFGSGRYLLIQRKIRLVGAKTL